MEQNQDINKIEAAAILFPSYDAVSSQYRRHRRAGVLTIEDPFNLPDAYKVTKGFGDRWLLEVDETNGVVFFASDMQLLAAAKCKYIGWDGTFDVCSKNFCQLCTILGLVCQLLSFLFLFWF